MKFITPPAGELHYLRADPVLWEQELDVLPEVAEDIERATGIRAGKVYWRSAHDHLYSLELADLGRPRPSMGMICGYWDRYEPRPPQHEILGDLYDFCVWVAEVSRTLDPVDVVQTCQYMGVESYYIKWPPGSVLRTPEDRFADLPDFPYQPKYAEVEGLRMAYVEEGAGDPILLLHGEPAWGYLYRHMIPVLAKAGRVIAPDLIGFGRSDKPVATNAYTAKSHARWLRKFIQALGIARITMVGHDWGGALGLRVFADMELPFLRVCLMNTSLPDGTPPGEAFLKWRRISQRADFLDVPSLMRSAVRKRQLTDTEAAAYGAPFPSKEYQTAARVFPRLVPIRPEDPGAYDNRMTIQRLKTNPVSHITPVMTIWSSDDPISAQGEEQIRSIFQAENVAPPVTIQGAGHFIQEDAGQEIAGRIAAWIGATKMYGQVRA